MPKARARTKDEPRGVYRCPQDDCKHRWVAALNWNAECPKCGMLQGPVVIK